MLFQLRLTGETRFAGHDVQRVGEFRAGRRYGKGGKPLSGRGVALFEIAQERLGVPSSFLPGVRYCRAEMRLMFGSPKAQLRSVYSRYSGRVNRFLAVVLICSSSAAWGQMLRLPGSVRQGNTLRIHGPAAAVTARMGDRSVRLFPDDGGSFGLMPVPVVQKPGSYTVELLDHSGAAMATAPVRVVDAHFPKQNVVIAESLAELKPSPDESETVSAFRKTVSDVRYWAEPLAAPVRGCRTSPFGVQRYLNGKPTGDFHGGIDQRSPAGTPIHAAAGGVVKIVREWNLHGHTVGIDHGQGLESIYLHMSKTAVSEGQTVKKGDVIGYVGSTGRSTAPHLHWSIYANGVSVNPLDWVQAGPCGAAKTAVKKRPTKN